MFYAYGLQALSQPTGNVKIGFSQSPMVRLKAHERGALGERLHIVFQTEAGAEYGSGRKLEAAYHKKFGLFRIIYEWFNFDPEMLIWVPDGTRHVHGATNEPAANTLPAHKLDIGDGALFAARSPVIAPYQIPLPESGDLSHALTIQKIVQRVNVASLRLATHRSASPRGAPQLNATFLIRKTK